MKDIELLPQSGRFYKANLHSHTVLSDGKMTPEQAKKAYQEQGYSILAYTDHRHYGWHPELCDENFIALAAFEVDNNSPLAEDGSYDRVKTYHMNFYDTDPVAHGGFEAHNPEFAYGDITALNAYVADLKQKGFLACYNHPYWSLQNYDDYKELNGFDFMEIYNHGCEIDGLYGWNPQSYDEVLRTGRHLGCFATDDNHNCAPFGDPYCDSFGGFTMLKLEKLTYEEVIHALKNGNYYASTGPEIHSLVLKDGAVHVKCSPCEKIYMITEGRHTQSVMAKNGKLEEEAVFTLDGKEGYIRIECRDNKGGRACSRAYFLTEFED